MVVVTGFEVVVEVTGFEVVLVPGCDDVVPTAVPEYVEPMSPKRMFEKVTCEFPWFASTSFGTPEVVAHGPRATPGVVADLSRG